MRDIVILLPGITGSVLQKDGKDIWAFSGSGVWSALSSLGSSLQQLRLASDDPEVDDLGDGISATRIMPNAHVLPGLLKIDGYTALSQLVTENFDVTRGTLDGDEPANYFEFPYDWRRDNRASARQLQRLIDHKLPAWREASGAKDAKVILLAHSMGGLVSRHYLEVLGGWKDCRALVTFGTPYRGSANALGFLANGYKQLFVDLTDVMRSCTSVYQLLPMYKMIKKTHGEYARIAEMDDIPNIDQARAADALGFHNRIREAVQANRQQADWGRGYELVPVVGIQQPTFQTAVMLGGSVTLSRDVPANVDQTLADGDGTVPYGSAIPIEFGTQLPGSFAAQRHASLQADENVLGQLVHQLRHMQIETGLEALLGKTANVEQPALSVGLDDVYRADEPARFEAQVLNFDGAEAGVRGRIESVNGETAPLERAYSHDGNAWHLEVEGLKPGLYRLQTETQKFGPQPVTDLFEIAPSQAD